MILQSLPASAPALHEVTWPEAFQTAAVAFAFAVMAWAAAWAIVRSAREE